MILRKSLAVLVSFFLFTVPVMSFAETFYSDKPLALQIIFDASESMADDFGGRTKLEAAKSALVQLVNSFGETPHLVSLRVFGGKTNASDSAASCSDSELLRDFDRASVKNVETAVQNISARGRSPIARSLILAGKDLKRRSDAKPMVLLITDGIETCGGRPPEIIRSLRKHGLDVHVHVIGLAVKDQELQELKRLASSGSGEYYAAADAEMLTRLTIDISRKINDEFRLRNDLPSKELRIVPGGETIAKAQVLKEGRYQTSLDLPRGKRAYFFVPMNAGRRALLTNGQQSSVVPDYRFDVQLYGRDKKKMVGDDGSYDSMTHAGFALQYAEVSGGGFYFSISNDDAPVPSGMEFDLKIYESSDIKPGVEAPEQVVENPPQIRPSEPIKAHLGLQDRADAYAVTLDEEEHKNIRVWRLHVRFSDPGFRFQIELWNPQTRLRLQQFETSQADADFQFQSALGQGKLVLRISDQNELEKPFSAYLLELAPVEPFLNS